MVGSLSQTLESIDNAEKNAEFLIRERRTKEVNGGFAFQKRKIFFPTRQRK
jgi:hypothetical protein